MPGKSLVGSPQPKTAKPGCTLYYIQFFGEETPQKRLDLTSFKEYLKYFGVRV